MYNKYLGLIQLTVASSLCAFSKPLAERWLKPSIRLSCTYLHAGSSCGSTRVHGLDVTGLAASHHEAPAHSIPYNLTQKKTC